MCHDINILQEVIDNEYEGDKQAVLEHLLSCTQCRQAYPSAVEEVVASGSWRSMP